MLRKRALEFVILSLAAIWATGQVAPLAQSGPTLLNYQGRLTNLAGVPVTAQTSVQLSLIRGGTASEAVSTGTVVYQETATITPEANGVFTHVIGTGTAGMGQSLTEEDFDTSSTPLFIEVSIASEVLLPRTRVLSVPYAIESSRLGGMTAQAIIGQTSGSAFANAVVRNGAGLEWLGNAQIRITPGTLGFPDGVVRRNVAALTWDFTNGVGPLGLDEGAEAANTWYYLYAVPDPLDDSMFTAVASIRTPTQIGGLGPAGYSVARFLGSFRNNASSDMRVFFRSGNLVSLGKSHAYWLLRSNQTLPNVNTWNPIDASSYMPETSEFIWLNGYYDSCGSNAGRFLLGPGTPSPSIYTWFCTDFGAGATTCEAFVPTIDRVFSWYFEVFSGSNDSCQHTAHDFVGYVEDLSGY